MLLTFHTILGIRITTSSKEAILSFVRTSSKKILSIVTPNPEQLVYAQKDKHFAQILNDADVALPDGIGLAKVLGVKRIPGVEFMEELVAMAAAKGWPVALIGGRGGVAEEALGQLTKKYPGLIGWVRELPEISVGDLGDVSTLGDVMNEIKKTNTKLVFVGLGASKQEFFIHRLMSYILHPTSPMVFMAVGGSFDILAGRVKRAPLFIRSMGFEWLWRLVLEPWRWKRQLALVTFMWLVLRKKVGSIDIL